MRPRVAGGAGASRFRPGETSRNDATTPPPRPADDLARVEALGRSGLLDTPSEPAFDDLTRLAARVCNAPMAAISLVDGHRQWFKSRLGLDVAETRRDVAFCAHTILRDDLMVVTDALADPRFARNPLVLGGPSIRFYAGMPLQTSQGHTLGTICVLDRVPRELLPEQAEDLRSLGRQAAAQIELRRLATEESRAREAAEAANTALRAEVAERLRVEALAHEGASILRGLYDSSPMAMGVVELTDDGDFRFLSVNSATAAIRGLDPEAIVGRRASGVGFTPEIIALWVEKTQESRGSGRPVLFEYALDVVVRPRCYSASVCPVAGGESGLPRFAFTSVNVTERKRVVDLLSCIHKAQAGFIADADPRSIFGALLEGALSLTGSAYGFIAELRNDPDGAEFLKCHAVTDISWNDEVRAYFAEFAPSGLEFRNMQSLYGAVIATGEAVLANDPANDPRRGRNLPFGYPPLDSFLGLPLTLGGKVVGMVGMANRPGGYDEETVRFLDPFLATCANLTEAHRNEDRRRTAEEAVLGLNAELGRRLGRLDALRKIDLAIASGHDLSMTLGVVLDQVMEQLKVDAADILLLEPGSPMLEPAAFKGFRTGEMAKFSPRIDSSLAGRAVLSRRCSHVDDLRDYEGPLPRATLMAAEGFVAYRVIPLLAKGQVKGILEVFHRRAIEAEPEWVEFLEALAGQAAIAVDNYSLFEGLQRSNLDLTLAYDATIEGWARALDLRDKETEGHSRRVTEMALRLARTMGVAGSELVQIRRGALLHDIGKMGIPDSILLKPGTLTDEEWVIMRKHPTYAFELLAPIAFLRPALEIPHDHHEKWDGTGYPRGLAGEQIPLSARIFAAVDIWDALRSDRPYRAGWTEDRVRAHLAGLSGMHLDPAVVRNFLALLAAAVAT